MQVLKRANQFILLLLLTAPCVGQMRHALVIGNDAYPGNELKNARNDATSIFDKLNGLGYDATLVLDANHAALSDSVDKFVDRLKPGDTAILYYAGHGFQLDGENYLVPVDFRVISPEVAKTEGYSLSSILERFTSHGATTQIVILDACRDNPFLGMRSMKGGWAGIGTSAGTFVAFGTSPGSTASDDPTDGHGLFTKDLLKYLTSSNEDIEEMFRHVREDVIRDSNGRQVPWVASSLIGTYHIRRELDLADRLLPAVDEDQIELSGIYDRSLRRTTSPSRSERDIPAGDEEDTQISRAIVVAQRGEVSNAIAILQQVLTLNPVSKIALDLLGLLLHAGGRDLDAVNTLNEALKLDPNDARVSAHKCAIEQLMGSPTALQDCEASAQANPTPETYMTLQMAQEAAN